MMVGISLIMNHSATEQLHSCSVSGGFGVLRTRHFFCFVYLNHPRILCLEKIPLSFSDILIFVVWTTAQSKMGFLWSTPIFHSSQNRMLFFVSLCNCLRQFSNVTTHIIYLIKYLKNKHAVSLANQHLAL